MTDSTDKLISNLTEAFDDANLCSDTEESMQYLIDKFIDALKDVNHNEPISAIAAQRAYTLWSYLINDGAFNYSMWWVSLEDGKANVASLVATPDDYGHAWLENLCVDHNLSADDMERYYFTADFSPRVSMDVDQLTVDIPQCQRSDDPTPVLDTALRLMARACLDTSGQVRFYQLDPDLPDYLNGENCIKPRAAGHGFYFAEQDAIETFEVGPVELAVVLPIHSDANPQMRTTKTATFMDWVNYLSIRCEGEDSPRWVPIKDLMIANHEDGSFDLYHYDNVFETTIEPIVHCAAGYTRTRSILNNLISRTKTFLGQVERFERAWKTLGNLAPHNGKTLAINCEGGESTAEVSFKDPSGNLVILTLYTSRIHGYYLPSSYVSLPTMTLLKKWTSKDEPIPNNTTQADMIDTWTRIVVANRGNEGLYQSLLETAVSNITTQHYHVQELEQLTATVFLEDNTTRVAFQIDPSLKDIFHRIDRLMREAETLNEATVLYINGLSMFLGA